MKTNAILSTILLLTVLLAACASAAPLEQPGAGQSQPIPATDPAAAATAILTQPEEQPQALATSRGDALVATDPTTVNLKSGTPTLLEFFRFTWGTCRSMAPIVHGLEAEYSGKINFVFLDADDPATEPWRREYGFFVQPEFYLLDGDGNVIRKWVGYVPADDFRAEFANLPWWNEIRCIISRARHRLHLRSASRSIPDKDTRLIRVGGVTSSWGRVFAQHPA